MDLEEAKFQTDLEKVIARLKWSSYHLSGESGLHDLLCFQKEFGFTLELKALKEKEINHSVHSLFKPSQMPFYLRQVADSNTPTYIALKYLKSNPEYYYFKLSTTKQIIDFFASKWKDVMNTPIPDVTSLFVMIERECKGFL